MSLLPDTDMPVFERVFIGTFLISSPLMWRKLPLTEKPAVYPVVEIASDAKSNTGFSPAYAQNLMRFVSEVPLFVSAMPAPEFLGVTMRYVPPRIHTVSPAEATSCPFWRLAKGCAIEPGFESLPVGAT